MKQNLVVGIRPTFEGTVIRGNQVGRTIGFPTANLEMRSTAQFPALNGVYSVLVYCKGRIEKGVMNVGVKPTFEQTRREKTFEVHLFDFNEEIYGERMEVEVCAFIRNEQKFPSLHAMIGQLRKDCQTAMKQLTERKEYRRSEGRAGMQPQVIHLPDLEFTRFCEETYGINRGVYNTIDKWIADNRVKHIVRRRDDILRFLQWVTFYMPQDGKVKFGSKGLSEQLERYFDTYRR